MFGIVFLQSAPRSSAIECGGRSRNNQFVLKKKQYDSMGIFKNYATDGGIVKQIKIEIADRRE